MRWAAVVIGLSLVVAAPASGQVKQWVDEEGTIHLGGEGSSSTLGTTISGAPGEEPIKLAFGDTTDFIETGYLHVQGVIKNSSSIEARWVKVKIRFLDVYGKLERIEEVYARPSSIPPGGEGTFRVMIPASQSIKKYKLEAYARR